MNRSLKKSVVVGTLLALSFFIAGCQEIIVGKAGEQCRTDVDCQEGFICGTELRCEELRAEGFSPGGCSEDSDCWGGGEFCENGYCVLPEGTTCEFDTQCQRGYLCDTGRCYPPCQDSDGGVNWEVQGTTTYMRTSERDESGNWRGVVVTQPPSNTDRCNIRRNTITEYTCIEGGKVLQIMCQARQRCTGENSLCQDVELRPEESPCQSDNECQLGLLCEGGTCQQREVGQLVPDTLGRQCQTDNDCIGNLHPPAVVCQDNICRGGIRTDCRYGCSERFPCDQQRGFCAPLVAPYLLQQEGEYCVSGVGCSYLARNCIMQGYGPRGSNIGPSVGFGTCQQSQREVSELCYVDRDCRTGNCIANSCRSEKNGMGGSCYEDNDCLSGSCDLTRYSTIGACRPSAGGGLCFHDNDCQSGLQCQEGICIPRGAQELRLLQPGCEQLREVVPGHNRLNEQKINLVFVGVNFPLDTNLKQVLSGFINYPQMETLGKQSLFATEPFKNNKNLFNLWYVDEIKRGQFADVAEATACADKCYTDAYKTDFCQLENKYTMNVCFANCQAMAFFYADGSSTHFSFPNIRPNWNPLELDFTGGYTFKPEDGIVGTHEFGHSFGELVDEYIFEGAQRDFPLFPNCADSENQAMQWWGDIEGQGEEKTRVGYFPGCSYVDSNVRPTENSLMRISDLLETVEDFGPVNYRHVCYRILEDTGRVDENCRRVLENVPLRPYQEVISRAVTGAAVETVVPTARGTPSGGLPQAKCNNDGVCGKEETAQHCPRDCSLITTTPQLPKTLRQRWTKKVLKVNLRKLEGAQYDIASYAVENRYPYIPYFEDSGIFDAQLVLNMGKKQVTKNFVMSIPAITEDFQERIIPHTYVDEEDILVDDLSLLEHENVQLVDYQLNELPERSIDIPLDKIALPSRFKLTLISKVRGINQEFSCQRGACNKVVT